MDGRVTMTRLVTISAHCDLGKDVGDYPFDQHDCPLRFGSLNYVAENLILNIVRWQNYKKIPPYGISRDSIFLNKWNETRRDFRSLDFKATRGMVFTG